MSQVSQATRRWLPLVLILIVAAFLRLFLLGEQSIWRDEAVTIKLTHDSIAQIVQNRANDNHVPFYFVFLRGWVALFGDSETSVRLPSAIFGIVGVFLMFRLGALLRDRATGLVAAFAMSISLLNIIHSREARMYSLMVMLVLLSMIQFIKLQNAWNRGIATGYLASTILLLYTHPYALFFVAAQDAYFLYRLIFRGLRGRFVGRWLILQGGLVLSFLPWSFVLVDQLIRRQEAVTYNWTPVPTFTTFVNSFGTFANSSYVLVVLFFVIALFAVWAILGAAGLFRIPERLLDTESEPGDENGRKLAPVDMLVLLVLWIGIPVVAPIVLSQFMSSFYRPRYAIAVTGAIILLVSWGIRAIRPPAARTVGVVLVAVFSLLPIISYLSNALGTPYWKQAVAYINQNAQDRETLLVYESEVQMGMFDYYPLRKDISVETYPPQFSAKEARAIVETEKPKRFIFVRDGIVGKNWNGILEAFGKAYRVTATRSYQNGVLLLVYEKKQGA